MKIRCLDVRYNTSVELENVVVGASSVLAIDASTNNTGISIVDMATAIPIYSLTAERTDKETPVQYKVLLKDVIRFLLNKNKHITRTAHEQVFIGPNVNSGMVLTLLKSSVEEIIAEAKGELDYIAHTEIPNKAWKKRFFAPDKCANNSEAEKQMAKSKLTAVYPVYKELTQDEIDAACIGIIFAQCEKFGISLKAKGPVHPFKYEIEFLGGDTLDEALMGLKSIGIPPVVQENGIEIIKITRNCRLDKKIYETMGSNDILIIAEISGKTAGNLILEHELYDLTLLHEKIYAFVWRKNRKK